MATEPKWKIMHFTTVHNVHSASILFIYYDKSFLSIRHDEITKHNVTVSLLLRKHYILSHKTSNVMPATTYKSHFSKTRWCKLTNVKDNIGTTEHRCTMAERDETKNNKKQKRHPKTTVDSGNKVLAIVKNNKQMRKCQRATGWNSPRKLSLNMPFVCTAYAQLCIRGFQVVART